MLSVADCLIEGPGAPDVPPRNPTMSRMNGRVQGIVNDLDMDFEPSCLVRTPSGNVYIPSGNLSKKFSNVFTVRPYSDTCICLIGKLQVEANNTALFWVLSFFFCSLQKL